MNYSLALFAFLFRQSMVNSAAKIHPGLVQRSSCLLPFISEKPFVYQVCGGTLIKPCSLTCGQGGFGCSQTLDICLTLTSPPLSSKRNLLRYKSKKNFSITPSGLSGRVTKNIKYVHEVTLQMFRVYSTSSRETFKAEAPIGVLQNSRSSLQLHLLRLRLGESFICLSRHINLYFKQKEVSVLDNGQQVFISEETFTRTQRRALRGRSSGDARSFIGSPVLQVQEASLNLSQEPPLTQGFARPQLFHISTIATTFGESYSYVASHINSVFSRNPAKEIHVEVSSDDAFRRSRKRLRKIIRNKEAPCQKNEQTQQNISMPTQTSAAEVHSNNESSSWEEGYLHFARHINRYFGAKVAYTVEESPRCQSQAPQTETEMLKSSVFLDKPLLERTQDSTSPPRPRIPRLVSHEQPHNTLRGKLHLHGQPHQPILQRICSGRG